MGQTGQSCENQPPIRLRGVTLRLENDSFAKTDRNYSHGMALTLESHEIQNYSQTECLPFFLRLHSRLITFFTPSFLAPVAGIILPHTVVAKFGQAIYTPGNFYTRELIENDRPYAGLIYVGITLNQRRNLAQSRFEVFDSHEVTFGVIGPLSFAKEVQDFAHDLFADNRFQGWGNQLTNEPAFGIAFEKKFKIYKGTMAFHEGFTYDFINSFGLRFGNIETSASYEIEWRAGWNLPNNFGSFTIRPGEESRAPPVDDKPSSAPNIAGIHLFTILGINLVGYDFSLDGNLFHESHKVTRRPWVTVGAVGLSLPVQLNQHNYNLAIMQVYHSGEFEEQVSTHSYRSVGLSIEF